MHNLRQTEHIINERRILYSINSKFFVNLRETFQSERNLYLIRIVFLKNVT